MTGARASRYVLIMLAVALGVLLFSFLNTFADYVAVKSLRLEHQELIHRIQEVHRQFREQRADCSACHRPLVPGEE